MKRILVVSFWTLVPALLAWDLYIGGVVVGAKVEDSEHFIMLRENKGVWVPVSAAACWAHFTTKYAMFAVCISSAVWMVWRWLRYGNFED